MTPGIIKNGIMIINLAFSESVANERDSIDLPDSLLMAVFSQKELESDSVRSALSYFADEILSFGQAAKMCNMTAWEFSDLLARKKVFRDYEIEDLENELNWLEVGLSLNDTYSGYFL